MAKFYAVELGEGKPEFLVVVVDRLVAILADATRALLKLEQERLKAERWKSILCGLFLCVVVEIDIILLCICELSAHLICVCKHRWVVCPPLIDAVIRL